MKILTLHFKNINSLEGESRIDFQQNPLANAGVFAIVGPNGSGKSSILDAISLAFYGETFRFDRPAEHVMTAHSVESFAQVEFALGEQKFRTRWQVQRKDNQPDGELLAAQMQLLALTAGGEEVLEQTSHGVCTKITEIIGMDFRNFSRSIMLAQGDFAAFLTALDSERMDILEKMNSGDIYEARKKELRDSTAAAQAAVAQIKQELITLPLMDAVTLEASADDLADFREQVSEYKQQQNEVREQLAWANKISSLENQLQTLQKNQRQTSQSHEQKKRELEQVATVQSVLVFKNDVAAINELQQQVGQSNKARNAYRLEVEQLKNQLSAAGLSAVAAPMLKSVSEQKQAIDGLKHQVSQLKMELSSQSNLQLALNKQTTEKQAIQTATLHWLESHTAEKSLLDHFPETARLRTLREEIIELDAQQQLSSRKLKKSEQALQKNEATLEQTKKSSFDYQQQLLAAEGEIKNILGDNSLAELESLLAEQQQRVVDFEELYALARVNRKVSSGGFFSFFSRKNETEQLDEEDLQRQADDLADQVNHAKNIKNSLEQAVLNEVLIQRLRHERPHLVDGKPCPLCGALQHPYSKLPPKDVDTRQALINQKIRLQELVSRTDSITRQIAAAQKQVKNTSFRNQNIQKVRAEFATLSNKLNVGGKEFSINNLSNLKEVVQQEQTELKNITRLLKDYHQQQDKITKLKLQIEKEQSTIKQLEQVRGQLSSDTGILPQELQDIEAALAKCQAEEKILAEQVLGQLTALGEVMPEKDKEAALIDKLTTRRREYYTNVLRDKALSEELTPLLEKSAANQKKIEQNTIKFKQLSADLQQEESAGLQLVLLEKQKLLQEQEILYSSQQQQLRSLQQTFETKLPGTQFSNFKQVTDALTLVAAQANLQQQIIVLETQLEQLAKDLQKTQQQLAAEQAVALTSASAAELQALQRSVTEKSAIATEEVRHLEEKLRSQTGLQEQNEVLTSQLLQQEKQLAELSENLQISESNGFVFRRQVQMQMIEQLLSQTNKMLEKISGRYYLRQMPTEQGLALEIEDTLQNIRRLPKSLSGGESFVLSLALALGLSELANNGRAVNSLFLDEGFGSLDAEVLNTVVNTLQSLRMQGKTVGVISHVDAVKKRIKTQIEMVKKPNGLSQLKKVS